MNKLSFRKKSAKTNLETVGVEHEYILAETIINDRPFLDYIACIETNHDYDYNIAKNLCVELTGESDSYHHWSEEYGWTHGWQDDWPGKNNAVLLICSKCFHEKDNPILFTFEETDLEVIWSGYRNDQTNRIYSEIPEFRFEKEQYKAAMEQLKEIAGIVI